MYFFSEYDVIFQRMTKWYLQIDPVFWASKQHAEQKQFMSIMAEFSEKILQHRLEKLKNLDDSKRDLMNSEDDAVINTQLSVIDRFLLSQELDKDELVKETFTIFTSVSISIVLSRSMAYILCYLWLHLVILQLA